MKGFGKKVRNALFTHVTVVVVVEIGGTVFGVSEEV